MPTVEKVARTNAGLASELRTAVMRLRRRLAHERHPDNELSLGAMAVLAALYRRDGQTVGELARFERVRPPSMTRMIHCLVDEGYAVRGEHESDGRLVVVRLTDKGRDTVVADRRRRDAWLTQRLSELGTDDREILRRAAPILDRLAGSD